SARSDSAERVVKSRPTFPGTARPSIWNIPHRQNPHFVGRGELLDQIRDTLQSSRAAALTAIHGLGGIGKSSLAVEFAYAHAGDYQIVWWIKSETTETIGANFSALATQLELPEKDARETAVVVEAVRRELGDRDGWLLIFDNAP